MQNKYCQINNGLVPIMPNLLKFSLSDNLCQREYNSMLKFEVIQQTTQNLSLTD